MAMYLGSNKVEIGVNNAGGSSSDFSTAQVTVINSSSYNISVSCPCIYMEDGENLALSEAYCEKSATTVIPCILYKGVCEISVSSSSPISASISGDIEEIVAFHYSVTGNGTITITDF